PPQLLPLPPLHQDRRAGRELATQRLRGVPPIAVELDLRRPRRRDPGPANALLEAQEAGPGADVQDAIRGRRRQPPVLAVGGNLVPEQLLDVPQQRHAAPPGETAQLAESGLDG